MTPFIEKLIWTTVAIALMVGSVFLPDAAASAATWMHTAAGIVFGSVWVARPEDRKGRRMPPLALLLVCLSAGCGTGRWSQIDWPSIATCGVPPGPLVDQVHDVARDEAQNGRGLSDGGRRDLAILAIQWGAAAVKCAIRSALSNMSAVSASSGRYVALQQDRKEEVAALVDMLEATEGGAEASE